MVNLMLYILYHNLKTNSTERSLCSLPQLPTVVTFYMSIVHCHHQAIAIGVIHRPP